MLAITRINDQGTQVAAARRGCLIARTAFYDDPAYAAVASGLYQCLSHWMSRFGTRRAEQQQLFGRMVFNTVVRNDDDHEQNHGLLHGRADQFSLVSAYDIVPKLLARPVNYHALLIGDSGARTVTNLVAVDEDFALSREEAREIVKSVENQVLNTWQDIF